MWYRRLTQLKLKDLKCRPNVLSLLKGEVMIQLLNPQPPPPPKKKKK